MLPVMVVFSFGPIGLLMAENYPVFNILKWLPSAQLILLEEHSIAGAVSDIILSLAVITVWTLVSLIIARILFKKRLTDD